MNSNACGICLFKVWEQDFCTASIVLYVLCVTQKSMKQVTKNIFYEKVGAI